MRNLKRLNRIIDHKESMKERTILFKYDLMNGRVSGDCGDIYNWLLDKNEELAEEFLKKYTAVAKWGQNKIKKDVSL